MKTAKIFLVLTIAILLGLSLTTNAFAKDEETIEYVEVEAPEKISNKEVDKIADDIGGTEIAEEGTVREDAPEDIEEEAVLTDNEEKTYNAMIKDPDANAYKWRSSIWLRRNPRIAWKLYNNYKWMNAHPKVALRLYGMHGFIWRYPRIAYVAYGNYVFLNKYPKITIRLYRNSKWLFKHPYVARRVFRNEAFLVKYPKVATLLYRNEKWLRKHPNVARIAYGNRKFLKKNPRFAKAAYRHRHYLKTHPKAGKKIIKNIGKRKAVEKKIIRKKIKKPRK